MLMNVQIAKCASFKTIPALPRRQLNHSDISTPMYLLSQKNKPQFLACNIVYYSYSKNNSGLFSDTGVYKLIITAV